MRMPRILLQTLFVSLFVVSCSNNEEAVLETPSETIETLANEVDKKEITFQFIDLMKNENFENTTIDLLKQQQPSVAMSKVLEATSQFTSNSDTYQQLSKKTTTLEAIASAEEAPDKIEILEVWMHNPEKFTNLSDVLFSFAPKGDEKDWTAVEAYTMDKELVLLDPHEAPEQAIIVIETNGFEALKKEVAYMNKQFQTKGIQNSRFANSMDLSSTSARNAGIQTTKLNKIHLKDDKEPWVSGAAEIYAITSGIKDASNSPEIKVIPLYYLDHDNTNYYPNQILLFWDDYKYQAANIQLFEKDDNHNYKDLTSAIVNGVFQIVGVVSGQPWVNVLGQVASAILQATPSHWYSNDDDYVDSFYTIEKNKYYTNYKGAANNATVNLAPFYLASN